MLNLGQKEKKWTIILWKFAHFLQLQLKDQEQVIGTFCMNCFREKSRKFQTKGCLFRDKQMSWRRHIQNSNSFNMALIKTQSPLEQTKGNIYWIFTICQPRAFSTLSQCINTTSSTILQTRLRDTKNIATYYKATM